MKYTKAMMEVIDLKVEDVVLDSEESCPFDCPDFECMRGD